MHASSLYGMECMVAMVVVPMEVVYHAAWTLLGHSSIQSEK